MDLLRRTRRVTFLVALLIALLTAVTACGGIGSGSDEATSSSDSGGATEPGLVGDLEGPADDRSADGDTGSDTGSDEGGRDGVGTSLDPLKRSVISRGEIGLQGDSVADLRADVLRLVASWEGTVTEEQSSGDRRGRLTDSMLTLRVPSDRFDTAMTALARIGRVTHQSRSAEDVSTQVIDTEARVRAAERSIRQIELLLGKAERIADVIAIESELARRQADLDSLKSQRAYLADQTSQSTIIVHLMRTDSGGDDSGFVAGLRDGWDALTGSVVALITFLGAALPFAVALALVGLPLWLVVRRRRSAR